MSNLVSENYNKQISCISHEIRNHLSICEMYSQIIKKNMEKMSVQNDSIDNALDCIQKSIQIINSTLLDLKSINSFKLQLFDFEKTVLKGVELSKAYVCDKNISFDVFIKNTATINVDENKFLACVVNVIKNGIESIVNDGVIEVIGEVDEKFAVLKISNNGEVIPKDKQKRIFEQGYTSKKTGNGLGLSICRSYLEQQNATLDLLYSTKSKTTFVIKIPIVE